MKGFKRQEWTKAKAERNEALDLLVYNLAMAHYLGIPRYTVVDWEGLRAAFTQRSLFAEPANQSISTDTQQAAPEQVSEPQPQTPVTSAKPTIRRTSRSGYLNRR